MALYSKKYGALKFGETTMLLGPDQAALLIEKYL